MLGDLIYFHLLLFGFRPSVPQCIYLLCFLVGCSHIFIDLFYFALFF